MVKITTVKHENEHLTYALVMARYRSWPAVSQIWAFIVLFSTCILLSSTKQMV